MQVIAFMNITQEYVSPRINKQPKIIGWFWKIQQKSHEWSERFLLIKIVSWADITKGH